MRIDSKTAHLVIACMATISAGCFVSTSGGLEGDAGPDTSPDMSTDATLDTVDEGDAPLDSPDGWDLDDMPDATDTAPDPDVPLDPVDTWPDTWPDTADTVAEDVDTDPGECTTTWDPACDDGNECTADFCDMVAHTCQHSGATMEGASCTSDGNECTNDFCRGGVCVHDAYRDHEFCTDDTNPCTDDYCLSGVCTHDGAPRDGDACADDGDICTLDECDGGSCLHPWNTGCCYRDGDCLAHGVGTECRLSTHACYTPPGHGFCATCDTREDCGDGGSGSDDYCIWDGTTPGCGKDCTGDYDCPRGASCYADVGAGTACTGGSGCQCYVRVGNCETWREWGTSCSNDAHCGGPDNYCFGDYCTWDCSTSADCPAASSGCVMGTCRR